MRHYGLDENNYFYGDFWENSAVIYSTLQQNEHKMLNRNFTGQGKLLQAYLRMAKKLDMVMWDLYQQMCLVCCSVEYNTVVHKQKELAFRAFEKLSEIMNINFT